MRVNGGGEHMSDVRVWRESGRRVRVWVWVWACVCVCVCVSVCVCVHMCTQEGSVHTHL